MSETARAFSTHETWSLPPVQGARSLDRDDVRDSLRAFALEKFDALAPLVCEVLDAALAALGDPETLDAAALVALRRNVLSAVAEAREAGLPVRPELEVIPFRRADEHWQRRSQAVLELLTLALRQLEWRSALTRDDRRGLLELMLRTRAVDEQLKAMFYPGVPTPIPGRRFGGKGFRSTWQEAIVGVARAMERTRDDDGLYRGDVAAPLIRDLGVGLSLGFSPREVLAAQLGKAESPMDGGVDGRGGRDLHWGDLDRGFLVPTAPLAIAASTLVGMALAFKRRGERRVCFTFIGEGGSSQGDWYEALNLAGVRRLPVVFVLQNNQVALGTPVERQSAVELFADKAAAAGMPSFTVDGSCPDRLFAAARAAREYALKEDGGPVLIAVEIMRGCGHAHHDDDRYRKVDGERITGYANHERYHAWAEREPLRSYPERLIGEGELSADELEAWRKAAGEEAEEARRLVSESDWADPASIGRGVAYDEDAATHGQSAEARGERFRWPSRSGQAEAPLAPPLTDDGGWTLRVAVEEALCAAADRHQGGIIFLGEDLEYGGAFGITQRLRSRGHQDRLLDTPLAESCIIGGGVGLALAGVIAVAEIQFNAFAAHAFSQIVNNAASLYWRYGAELPLVIRIPVGAGLAGGPYHALSNEAWFTSTPGLKILYPSTPHDAYHGLLEAIEDPGPVLFFEHLTLYPPVGKATAFGFPVRQDVDIAARPSLFGKADRKRAGEDLTIVSYGAAVHFALRAAEVLAKDGIAAEVLDLRSLWPLDIESCARSVEKTKRLMVVHEAQHRGGYGHYVLSRILEAAFMDLDAPPLVIGAVDIPPPFAPHLEAAYLPGAEVIARAARDLLEEAERNRGG